MLSVDPATGASTEIAAFGQDTAGFFPGCEPGDVLAVGARAVAPWSVLAGPVPGSPGPCIRGQSFWLAGPGVSSVDTGTSAVWEHDESQGICNNGATPSVPRIGPISSDGTSVLFPEGLKLNALPLDCTATGCPVSWSVDLSSFVAAGSDIVGPAVALSGGDLAVATRDGHVLVVDGTSHLVEWTATVGASITRPLAATTTTVFATGVDGTVAAFPVGGCGATTCPASWTATLASPASARPSIGGDVLYVGSADGTVTALPANGCGQATCTGLWTGTTPAEISGPPAIFSGTVVVGSFDGTVTAFALPAA
jgi:outer membrane protein assembly factor BamB